MSRVLTQKYTTNLAEKCRKALEASFGEIPMPKIYTNSKTTKKRKIIIKKKNIKNIRNSKLPLFF